MIDVKSITFKSAAIYLIVAHTSYTYEQCRDMDSVKFAKLLQYVLPFTKEVK